MPKTDTSRSVDENNARIRKEAMVRNSDPGQMVAGLKSELAALEAKAKVADDDAAEAKLLERAKQVKAQITKYERLAKTNTRIFPGAEKRA